MEKLAEHIGLGIVTIIFMGGCIGLFVLAINYLTSF